ncbi:MAG: hypothetical protein WCR02_06350 [Sphaerochaetaceae bacterium]
MVKKLLLVSFLSFSIGSLFASISIGGKTSLSLSGNKDTQISTALTTLQFDVKSDELKGCFALSLQTDSITKTTMVSLFKAYGKYRNGNFQLLAGKAPLPWGGGSYFNAGNLLFPDTATIDETYYVPTTYLVQAQLGIMKGLYIETVGLLPVENTKEAIASRVRYEIGTPLLDSVEASCIYHFDDKSFWYSLGISGNLYFDMGLYAKTTAANFIDDLNITAFAMKFFPIKDNQLLVRGELSWKRSGLAHLLMVSATISDKLIISAYWLDDTVTGTISYKPLSGLTISLGTSYETTWYGTAQIKWAF